MVSSDLEGGKHTREACWASCPRMVVRLNGRCNEWPAGSVGVQLTIINMCSHWLKGRTDARAERGCRIHVSGTGHILPPKVFIVPWDGNSNLVLVGIPETHVIIVRLVEVDKRGCACRQIVDIIQPGYQRWYIHLSRFSLSD